MLSEGTAAPAFELPALVDGERKRVALSEYLGEDVVVLAFYPADFNPACDETSCDLGELDLFTMQKDVTILGISPDSVYSHRAFADRYDLKIPLLADTDHEVASEYGVEFVDPIGQRLVERAVVVIDHDGVVQYAWSTDDLRELPRVEEVKDAIADTGGGDTAFARYRVGHAHYTEGRRAFTAAMDGFRDSEWVVAQGDFQRAREEFEAAEDHFDTAVRFGDDGSLAPIYEGAKAKANALWQASDWLTRAASAYSSGEGAEGQELRDDAECPLEDARGYREPPDPDEQWPPGIESLEKDEPTDESFLPTEEEDVDTSLGVDIDDEVERGDGEAVAAADDGSAVDETGAPTASEAEAGTSGDRTGADSDVARAAVADGDGELTDVDETDIEEIQAELAASEAETQPTEPLDETPTAMVDAPPEPVGSDESREGADAGDAPTQTESDDSPAPSEPRSYPSAETDDGTGDGSAELDLTDPTADDGDVSETNRDDEPDAEARAGGEEPGRDA